jgi:hypothetical protein
MTRTQTAPTMSLDRNEIEQIAYILGRLEKLLTADNDNGLALQVTHFLVAGTDIEWLARWIIELRSNLHRRLFLPGRDRRLPPKQSIFGP